MREAWLGRQFGRAAVAAPVGFVSFVPARAPGFNLVVDLGDDLFSRNWWRGFATLGALCPPLSSPRRFGRFRGHPAFLTGEARDEWRAVG